MKTLEERAALLERLANRAGELNQTLSTTTFNVRAREHRQQADLIRSILERSRKAA